MDNIKKCFCKKYYKDNDGYIWSVNNFYSYLEYDNVMYVSTIQYKHSNSQSTLPMARMKKKVFKKTFEDIDERRENLIVNILE